MKRRTASTLIAAALFLGMLLLPACACSSSTNTTGATSSSTEASSDASNPSESSNETMSSDASSAASSNSSSDLSELAEDAESIYQKGVNAVTSFIEERKDAVPQHYAIGEMAAATKNLAVGVIAVEAGPYDYRDGSPTTKVTVAMANTSEHTVTVKASNWNADTTDGLRVDHKLAVYGDNGKKVAESFMVGNVSPKATYTAVIYFDGDLVDVLYEPHWLISSQNQYLYWDIK